MKTKVSLRAKQEIVINKDGRLLKEARQWKTTGNYSNAQILARLENRGLKLHAQKLSKIWRNPFSMPATEQVFSAFVILLYFSNAAYEKFTPRPVCRNFNSGTSAMRERWHNLTSFKL